MNIDNLIREISQEGAKKALPNPMRVAAKWLFLMVVYFVVLLALSGFRSDIAIKFSQPLFMIEFVIMLMIAITAAYAASLLALPDSAQKPWIRFIPFVFLAFLLGVLAYQIFTTQTLPLTDCLKLGNYQCMMHIIFYAILPAIVMFMTVKKAAPIKYCWVGSAIGLCVASLGYAIMRLVEASDDPTTLLIWHFIPVFLIIVVGMMLGETLLGKIWRK